MWRQHDSPGVPLIHRVVRVLDNLALDLRGKSLSNAEVADLLAEVADFFWQEAQDEPSVL